MSTATDATKPTPSRKLSIDLQTAENLEKRLNQRPDKKNLIDRNILKGVLTSVYTVWAS